MQRKGKYLPTAANTLCLLCDTTPTQNTQVMLAQQESSGKLIRPI